MTKERAVELLQRYSRYWRIEPSYRLAKKNANYRKYGFKNDVYEKFVINDLIKQIQNSPGNADPIEIVRKFYDMMDDGICESESPNVWAAASIMENTAHDILDYLRRNRIDVEDLPCEVIS